MSRLFIFFGLSSVGKTWLDQWVKTNFDNKVLRDIYRQYHNAELPDDLTSR